MSGLAEFLEGLEFAGYSEHDGWECPSCDGKPPWRYEDESETHDGHAPNCEMARRILEAGGSLQEPEVRKALPPPAPLTPEERKRRAEAIMKMQQGIERAMWFGVARR